MCNAFIIKMKMIELDNDKLFNAVQVIKDAILQTISFGKVVVILISNIE